MVFSLPDLDHGWGGRACFADISIVTEDRVERGSFILEIQQVFAYNYYQMLLLDSSHYIVQQRLSAWQDEGFLGDYRHDGLDI